MTLDLTKFGLHTGYPGFKNNNVHTGTLTISGTASMGLNTRSTTVSFGTAPDMSDLLFNGPTAWGGTTDPRPSNGWFKRGYVYIRGDSTGYVNYPTPWNLSASLSGSTLTITAYCRLEFNEVLTLTSTNISWRLVDYSVF